MSEYRVIKVEGKPPFFLEYQLLAPNGRLLIEVNQYGSDSLINARDILNQETVKLQAEIASLQEANADLLAAAEVRSEELGKARGFIRELAERVLNGEPAINEQMAYAAAHTYYDFKERAQALLAQWEAESESEAVE